MRCLRCSAHAAVGPERPVPEEVAKVWAEEWAKEGKQIDWRRLMLLTWRELATYHART
jgi:hypothetical protein